MNPIVPSVDAAPLTNNSSIEHTLQTAIAHHQAGQWQDAENLYLQILKNHSKHPEANHNFGILAVQLKQPLAALSYLMIALEANPAHSQYWSSYINALIEAGQADNAREVLAMAQQQGLTGNGLEELAIQLDSTFSPESDAPFMAQVSLQRETSKRKKPKKKSPAGSNTASQRPDNSPAPQEIDALVALFNANRLAEALSMAQSLTLRFPAHGFGWKALGTIFNQMGRAAEALLPMQKAATLLPNDAQLYSNLAITLQSLGRLEEAETSLRHAISIDADFADAHSNLGSLLQDSGRLNEAVSSFMRAIQSSPNFAAAHYNLGNTYRELMRLHEAEASYLNAIRINPGYGQAYSNLGATLHDLGRFDEAEVAYRNALRINPAHAEAYSNLGNTLQELGRLDEAERYYRLALEISPHIAETHNNLGNTLQELGRLDEAESSYRRALEISPDYVKAHSNLLFLINYHPYYAASYGFAEALRYGQNITSRVSTQFTQWGCALYPKRLRIGFVSGDFKNHPVGYFLENLLENLDPTGFDLVAYPTNHKADELTARIKPRFSAWRPLYGLSDEAAAALIHDDNVHILIDLSGHTRYNRLPVFAWKPAPVQVSWLGYFATTGVAEIDYFIADPWTLPEVAESYFTENIWRLPETRLCFTPPDTEIAVSPLPAASNGYVTFGCFNHLSKMNDAVIALWSRILAAVPGSRLFLKARQLAETKLRQQTIERFAVYGIAQERLLLQGAESRSKYLAAYHQVDIALDPFPYPGGTTTVESLWMGVPVLTLAGESFLSRQGMGIMENAGLPDWVTLNADEYLGSAVMQAGNLQGLATLRNELRHKVLTSPIMDGKRFADHFELALRGMWQTWLEKQLS